jgi:predicted HNH restriction endonuclease
LNSLDDLAVLCGNCHLMIHANPRLAMSVEELRSIWRYSREIATK